MNLHELAKLASPAPWTLDPYGSIRDANGRYVGSTDSQYGHDVDRPNAELIVALRNMLEDE